MFQHRNTQQENVYLANCYQDDGGKELLLKVVKIIPALSYSKLCLSQYVNKLHVIMTI